MRNWFKVAVSAAAVVIVAGTAVASAAPSSHALLQPANPHVRSGPLAAVDTATESKYTAIAPCRIVDTRVGGGPLSSGHGRSFYALGTAGFGTQGGAGCDIPTSATSVTGSIIAVGASANGYVKVFAYGASLPTASFLNYSHTTTLSASGTIPVVHSTHDFSVVTSGGTVNLVIQLTGYYVPPMWAEISSGATYVAGSRVASVSSLGTGTYQVDFDRNISGCAYSATAFFTGQIMNVEPRSGDANAVFIQSVDYNGNSVNSYFYLTVTC